MITINSLIKKENEKKIIFTAGPSSLINSNLSNIKPCFGRGDKEYLKTEKKVLNKIKKISGGFENIARFQGSGSLAIEIMMANYLYGNIIIIDTGYYAQRLNSISNQLKLLFGYIKKIDIINWKEINTLQKKYDWVIACSTETSCGIKIPIETLSKISKKCKSKLMLDATGSIGLEKNHELADVISFSSCKGLFGLTGAGFICYNKKFTNYIPSFYLNLQNHIDKKMTGPYQILYSLEKTLEKHSDIKYSVIINKKKFMKKMKNFLTVKNENQPNLCTHVNKIIKSKSKKVILYSPRNTIGGSVVCHIGEAHLGKDARGKIVDLLY
jgi:aspartate aminotransferase-like enzyme